MTTHSHGSRDMDSLAIMGVTAVIATISIIRVLSNKLSFGKGIQNFVRQQKYIFPQ